MKVINDLFDYENLKIVQDENAFKFGLDSILLAEFVDVKLNDKQIIDFCTGNAPIPLILTSKTTAKITGIELQKEIFENAVASIKMNDLEEQISLINDDIKNVKSLFKAESFDIVTCNPPYFKVANDMMLNNDINKRIARHELLLQLCDVINSAAYVLKNNGSLFLVHRPERLEEIIHELTKNRFSIKKIQFVYGNLDKNAIIVLIKATKNGNPGLKVLKPIDISKYDSYKGIMG